MTRRHWLQTSAAFAGAASLLQADDALPNRSSEAKPITPAERTERIARAQQLMAERKLDAIVLTGGTSLVYFSGIRWWNSERLFAMVIPKRGDPFFVSPAFEEERVKEQIGTEKRQILVWQEDQSPYERVAFGLRERGAATGRIGLEETVKFVFADGIGKALPTATLQSATAVTAGCRSIKSAHELALMQLANAVTLQAYEWSWKHLHAGMTQHDFGDLIASAYHQLGFPGEASVQVGQYTALPHGSAQPQTIGEGEIIMIDDGCTVEGYQSDITRTFVLGRATDQMKRVFDIVHRAQSAALQAAKPGVSCGAVDAAARKVIGDAGFGPDYAYFSHRVGHGIGMDGHEWPYLVRGNPLPLARGMTFSDEPGIYIRGEFGVRLEDDMHVTEDGAQLFTPQSPSLEQPFSK